MKDSPFNVILSAYQARNIAEHTKGNSLLDLGSVAEDFDTDERFDTITLINVLEYADDPLLVLKKAEWWLASEGVIIIHVANALSLDRQLGLKTGLVQNVRELPAGCRRFYDPWTLRKDIVDAGLRLEGMGGVMLKPFSDAQMYRIADEWKGSERVFDGLYELAREMPWYSDPIWAVCRGG